MTGGLKSTAKIALVLAVIAFVLIGGLSLPHFAMSTSMDMDGNMTMNDCYMPGMTAICNMSPLQHVSEWQKLFTTTIHQMTTIALLVLLALAVALSQFLMRSLVPKLKELPIPKLRYRYRYRERFFDPLRLAFARGIIHPKVF